MDLHIRIVRYLFVNELELIHLRTSITIVSTYLYGSIHSYLILIILFPINQLFAGSEEVTNIAM